MRLFWSVITHRFSKESKGKSPNSGSSFGGVKQKVLKKLEEEVNGSVS